MKNNKSLGQHWLKNRVILEEIADLAAFGAADLEDQNGEFLGTCLKTDPCNDKKSRPSKSDTCLEIGPGLGTLTSSLLKRFDRVIAVEYDARLAENLPRSFPGKNLEVVQADFLQCDLSEMPAGYVVAGNIPYYITSPIIEKLIKEENRPRLVVLLVQKEVAERVAAVGGRRSVMSLMVENRAEVRLGLEVPAREFTPPPKVDSQVLVLEPHAAKYPDEVFKLIRQGFSSPRKKLVHNLPQPNIKEALTELGVSVDARPADLTLEQWNKLYRYVA